MSLRCNDGFVSAFSYREKQLRNPLYVILERSKTIKVDTISKRSTKKMGPAHDDIQQFLKNQAIQQEIESIHEVCDEIRSALSKTRDLNKNRSRMLYPKYKNTIHGEHVDKVIDRVNDAYESCIIRKIKSTKKETKNSIESEKSNAEDKESVCKKPRTFIKSIHENYEDLMKSRGERVTDEVRHYKTELQNIDRRIFELSKAFHE